jgi:hypothetical protein
MEKSFSTSERIFIGVGIFTGWFAVLLQLYLIILNRKLDILQTMIQFFSYFTILSNILVAVCLTVLLFNRNSKWGTFFSKPQTLTALAVYISIVGLVYNLILRFLWAPQGMQRMVDELLHSFNPLWFFLYWLIFVSKGSLQWKNVFPWLWYPLFYCVYVMIRGALSDLYPYPFIDVTQLGYSAVLVNCVGLCGVFLVFSLLLVGIGKVMGSK